MSDVLIASINIFFSLVLGAVALVLVAIHLPDVFNSILNGASWLEGKIGSTGLLDVKYNVWVRFLIDKSQLTFMFFVLATRIILAIFVAAGRALARRYA